MPDDAAKLDLYRRLARTVEPCEFAAVRAELGDRFGPLPAAAERLLLVTELRALGARVGLDTVLARGDEARLVFRRDAQPRLARPTPAPEAAPFRADGRRGPPPPPRPPRPGGPSGPPPPALPPPPPLQDPPGPRAP